jgi:protein involved in polysaccharide export with SLBB domain
MPFDIPSLRSVLALLLVAVALVGVPRVGRAQTPVIPPPSDIANDSSARPVGGLRQGDLLRVTVFHEKDLSGEFLIDNRGTVQMPGIGIIKVAGLDPTQARERLIAAFQQSGFSQPELAVQAVVRVLVLGEVNKPALYPVEPGTTLLQAITIAGGPSPRADLRRTTVVRDGKPFTIDFAAALAGGASGRVILYSGDYVVLPRKRGPTQETLQLAASLGSVAFTFVNLVILLGRK